MSGLIPFERKNHGIQSRHNSLFDMFDVDRFFNNFFNEPGFPTQFNSFGQMRVDISENEKEFILEAELPGVKKEDINIELNDDRLTISANCDENTEDTNGNYIRRERRVSSMSRTFSLENVIGDKISAKHENGILTLTLPKKEQTKSTGRKIDIN